MLAFLATIGAFIDDTWTLHETLINFQCLYGMHSSVNMAASLFKTLESINIVDKVSFNLMVAE